MKNERRINIGLFVNSLQNDYSTLMCQGAAIAAEELDANLLIVPGREVNAEWDNIAINRFENQSNVLYSFITSCTVDVLIVSMGTVGFFLDDEERKNFLSRYKGMKVIVLESEVDGYPSILFNSDGLREEIEHFIKVHNKRKIAFFSGPSNNMVANERLQIFREVLRENGIEPDEKYIGYGDFTDYCDRMVEKFFDGFGGDMPEVLICANDTMVKSVKNVCDARGIRLGSDFLVAGYDDAAFASVMVPPLTTVKSNIMTMGYQAVHSAVNYHRTGVFEPVSVRTNLILRQSCGCSPEEVRETETQNISMKYPREELIQNIIEYTVKKSSLDIIPRTQIDALRKFIGSVYDRIKDGYGFSTQEISDMVSELMSSKNLDFLTFDSINAVMFALKKLALEGSMFGDNRESVFATFESVFRSIGLQFAEKSHSIEDRMITDRFVFSRIADDMMASGSDEGQAMKHLMNDISMLHVNSCYLYLYHQSILSYLQNNAEDIQNWKRPDNLYLKAFFDHDRFGFPQPRDQRIEYDSFFTNRMMPYGRRRTMVLQALYFNTEQYGIILLESEIGLLFEIMNISKQICTSIKLSQFMNQLEGALEDVRRANRLLSAESVSDQLTGIYNRRGFISESEKQLRKYNGVHCSGAVIYADLDCLKVINDTFGHREGDFAIRKASDILVGSLRDTDVIGRVGGDEFVALVMDIDSNQIDDIRERVRRTACEFNRLSDKPYNVGISMGVYMFDTFSGESIDQLMSGADRDLYSRKKMKNRSVLKEQQAI